MSDLIETGNWTLAEQHPLSPLERELLAAVDQMRAHEDAGGEGWWKGWEMLKAAHAKAGSR